MNKDLPTHRRRTLQGSSLWVVKIGSALLTNDGQGLDKAAIGDWVKQLVQLKQQGKQVVLVSSGSVAEGMQRLGWNQRPHLITQLQAAAAVGQMGLIETYEQAFASCGFHSAQILLTHDDLSHRKRYLNARGTIQELLNLGVVPIINENDTVVTDEIRFGDNDTLAALTANLINAEALVILTDQSGLFTKNPREFDDAQWIESHCATDDALLDMASGKGGALGRGGMLTKVLAAQRAAKSGCVTVIASGRETDVLLRVAQGETLGTLLWSDVKLLDAKKRWLASHLNTKGRLVLDDGAVQVLQQQGKSLLPVGIRNIIGSFERGELVDCVTLSGQVIAKGLVNYDSDALLLIKGVSSQQIESILGFITDESAIHRDNLVLVDF